MGEVKEPLDHGHVAVGEMRVDQVLGQQVEGQTDEEGAETDAKLRRHGASTLSHGSRGG